MYTYKYTSRSRCAFFFLHFFLFFITAEIVYADEIQTESFKIATGSKRGLYNAVGELICDVSNSSKEEENNEGIRYKCSVQNTLGSFHNLNALKLDNLELGIVQYDMAEKLYTNSLLSNNFKMLRILLELYTEAFTIFVKEDSNIYTLDDIKKKRINYGVTGSGISTGLDALLAIKGWRKSDNFAETTKVSREDQIEALCNGQIDIAVDFIVHPNKNFVSHVCSIRLIPIPNDIIERIIDKYPYYTRYEISPNLYKNKDVIKTFGVKNGLFSTVVLSDNVARHVVSQVIENIDKLKKLHAVLSDITPEKLFPKNKVFQLHDGAVLAFENAGIINSKNNNYDA